MKFCCTVRYYIAIICHAWMLAIYFIHKPFYAAEVYFTSKMRTYFLDPLCRIEERICSAADLYIGVLIAVLLMRCGEFNHTVRNALCLVLVYFSHACSNRMLLIILERLLGIRIKSVPHAHELKRASEKISLWYVCFAGTVNFHGCVFVNLYWCLINVTCMRMAFREVFTRAVYIVVTTMVQVSRQEWMTSSSLLRVALSQTSDGSHVWPWADPMWEKRPSPLSLTIEDDHEKVTRHVQWKPQVKLSFWRLDLAKNSGLWTTVCRPFCEYPLLVQMVYFLSVNLAFQNSSVWNGITNKLHFNFTSIESIAELFGMLSRFTKNTFKFYLLFKVCTLQILSSFEI